MSAADWFFVIAFPTLCLVGGILLGVLMIEVAKLQDEAYERKQKNDSRDR